MENDMPTEETNLLAWSIVKEIREVELDSGGSVGNYTLATTLYAATVRGIEAELGEEWPNA